MTPPRLAGEMKARVRRSAGAPKELRHVSRRALLLIPLVAAGCSTRYIGDTQIEDTDENREVLRVVEQYRRAVEDRDVQRILDLTSDKFFEDPGTPHDPKDDYDKAGLKARLDESFAKVKDQHLELAARKLALDEELRTAVVDYVYDHRYRLQLAGSGEGEWRKDTDVNRVALVREGEQWKIVSGI